MKKKIFFKYNHSNNSIISTYFKFLKRKFKKNVVIVKENKILDEKDTSQRKNN